MKKLNELKQHLKPGKVYRRSELAQWSNAVDRHVAELLEEGFLEKMASGLYYFPKKTIFGRVPPNEDDLVRSFLKDDDFLITSPNAYNSLGVGTTQLYNKRIVYNHKRHGEFKLGQQTYFFHAKHRFPSQLTQEFLLVDLVNNLGNLAEDREQVLKKVSAKAKTMDTRRLANTAATYGGTKAKALFSAISKS